MTEPPEAAPRDASPDAWLPEFPVVGIGASAGGLEALESLTKRLVVDGMAYVVFPHLAPSHDSVLAKILARGTSIKVATVSDGLKIELNVVYVAPPNADVTVDRGFLRLRSPAEVVPLHSIDAFFRSLADNWGTAAIAVVLSGAGTDGTLGLRAVKDAGGMTFAQEPSTAGQPGMPESAINAGVVDFCLSPVEIGDELMRLGTQPFVTHARPTPLVPSAALQEIYRRLQVPYGVDFNTYKQATIERRIARRMALQRIDEIDRYLAVLASDPAELSALYGDMLIGVTNFFRDTEPFHYLKEVVFPRFVTHRAVDQPIRIWVAGCATGEEAYSIAMCLIEFLDERKANPRIQIFATDIDDTALETARLGTYPASIELDLSPARLQRFFSRTQHGYQVSRHVRDLVVFARHNLGKDPPFSRLDLVTCRNVLIYMQLALQRRVLRILHYALQPEAFMLLGTSESVGDMADLFSMVDRRVKLYQKKNAPSAAVFDFGMRTSHAPLQVPPVVPIDHRPIVTVQQLADRKAIERYAPPGVLLNEQLEVLQFRGHTGSFVAPSPGTATLNVFKLARPELLVQLRATLERAVADRLPASSAEIPAWDPDHGPITIDVVPVYDAQVQRRCLLVAFRQSVLVATAAVRLPVEPHPDTRVIELERELTTTREYLETTVQELGTANEDLQSSNEELQSSNEELQSSNEELETSKEELQSTNEELASLNEELQNRMAQLATSTDDLQNLLADVTSAVVLDGMDLRIRRFTASAERVLNLIASDAGRPVSYLDNVLKPTLVAQVVGEVIHTITTKEQRVRTAEGTWYTMRTSPYRTTDLAIRGAMVELTRVATVRKGDGSEVSELEGRLLSALPYSLALLDAQLRVIYANKRFFERFQFGAEIIGRALDEVWPPHTDHDVFWTALHTSAATGEAFLEVRVSHPFGRADIDEMRCAGYRVAADGERRALTMLTMSEAPPRA